VFAIEVAFAGGPVADRTTQPKALPRGYWRRKSGRFEHQTEWTTSETRGPDGVLDEQELALRAP